MSAPQPGWYADPSRSAELRWWDGSRWTDQVVRGGVTATVPLPDPRRREPVPDPPRSLLAAPVLVVSQRAKVLELTAEYDVRDGDGRPLGTVVQVGETGPSKALRFLSDAGRFLTSRLEVRDAAGHPVLLLTRPPTVLKSRVVVERPGGGEVGQIVQESLFGRARFALLAEGRQVGALRAVDLRSWDVSLTDDTGTEVARVRKTVEGVARALFTSADDYLVRVHRPLPDPLRSLVLASALTIDTVLKQTRAGVAG